MKNALADKKPGTPANIPMGRPTSARYNTSQMQQDGHPAIQFEAPTKARLQTRPAVPGSSNDSGMEKAMNAHADQMHKFKR